MEASQCAIMEHEKDEKEKNLTDETSQRCRWLERAKEDVE